MNSVTAQDIRTVEVTAVWLVTGVVGLGLKIVAAPIKRFLRRA